MPAEGVQLTPSQQLLTSEEVVHLARLFTSQGVDKIRLTGGEPLVRANIEELVRSLAALPGLRSLAMTTNGVTLRHKVAALKEAGLDTINISLDTMVPEKFEFISRRARKGDPFINQLASCQVPAFVIYHLQAMSVCCKVLRRLCQLTSGL